VETLGSVEHTLRTSTFLSTGDWLFWDSYGGRYAQWQFDTLIERIRVKSKLMWGLSVECRHILHSSMMQYSSFMYVNTKNVDWMLRTLTHLHTKTKTFRKVFLLLSWDLQNFESRFNSECAVKTCVGSRRKAVPLQPWTGPDGSRKLRFPDFVTTA